MPENPSQLPERSGKTNELLGWLREFFSQFRLAWRLFWDENVPFETKLIPILTMLYLVMPIDLVPDAFFGVGQVDDLVLLLIGLRVFISLCPADLVDQYRHAFTNVHTDDTLIPDDVTIIDVEVEQSDSRNTSPEDTTLKK